MKKHVNLILSAVAFSNISTEAAPTANHLLSQVVATLDRQGEHLTASDQQNAIDAAARWLSPKAQARGSSLSVKDPTDPPLMF